ncbi:MAG: hypothetical protein KDE35_02700 [Geminicoccaceae bacterium]|nr:hypothetical protein [Geminicoccaceae bacterium]
MPIGPWGRRPAERREVEAASAPGSDTALREAQPTCEQCGAVLAYAPGSDELECAYCGHRNRIEVAPVAIVEHDLSAALRDQRAAAPLDETEVVTCSACAASFTFDPDVHAGECPFCGHAIVTDTGAHRQIKPEAVLPFEIAEPAARERVRAWLHGLWFAPNRLKRFGQADGALHGVYLPYWTFDSATTTDYRGRRGDVYYEPRQVRVNVGGKTQVRTEMVRKVRWTPARGRVSRNFDDVLVLASPSLPVWMTDRLEPWDLGGIKPYTAYYLTGFQAEAYRVELDAGFALADEKMKKRIAGDVRLHIGGDLQQITSMDVHHADTTFKHILLPVWLGAFRYGNQSYHVSVNGQTGAVQGERPYSWWKIAGAVLLLAIIGGILAFIYVQSGGRLG